MFLRSKRIVSWLIRIIESIDALKARRIKESSYALLAFIGAIQEAWG